MWTPETFAADLLRLLRQQDPAAAVLAVRAHGKTATIGLLDNEVWVPLLRLAQPSAACNVMSLQVRHKRAWAPTLDRGTSEALAQVLLGSLRFTWAIEAEALAWSGTSGPGH
jgi:hypothetical protein